MKKSVFLTCFVFFVAGCIGRSSLINTTFSPDILIGEKPRIAVLPMELSGYADEDLTVVRQNWRNMVEAGFLENSFRVIDRDVVDNILKEQRFQRSGVVNTTTSVEVGKILGINYVLMGTVRVLANDGSKFHIQLRIVNVQSAELVATSFATGGPDIGYRASADLAKKLKAKFNPNVKVD